MYTLVLHSEFGALVSSKIKICPWHYSQVVECSVVSSEITCGGSGELTRAIVNAAGSFSQFTKATILSGVHVLKGGCFNGCIALVDVNLSQTVQKIEDWAFDYCPIVHFRIHSNLTNIASAAFNNCCKLMYLEVDTNNPAYTSVDGLLLTKDLTTIVIIPHGWTTCSVPSTVTTLLGGCNRWGLIETIVIPDHVTSIGSYAFYSSQIRNVTIGKGLITFHADAVHSCVYLERIVLDPENSNFYSENGVFGVKDATSGKKLSIIFIPKDISMITITKTISAISSTCFQYATNVTHVTSENSVFSTPDNQMIVKDKCVIACAGGAENVTIPELVTAIGNAAFKRVTSLKRVTFNSKMTTIATNAFRGCSNLEVVNWNGYQTTTINGYVFAYVKFTQEPFAVPESVKTISENAFLTSGVINITLPSVESIHYRGFGDCKLLEYVSMPKVVSIESQSFYKCSSLKTVLFGSTGSLKTIASMAFASCISLESISIPKTTGTILPSAFVECASLLRINVDSGSSTLASVDGVVYNKALNTILICPWGLETVKVISTTTAIGTQAFYGCALLRRVTLTDTITTIDGSAFYGCVRLELMWLPKSVSFIGAGAFGNCWGLRTVALCNTRNVDYKGDPFPTDPVVYVSQNYDGEMFCGHKVRFLDSFCNIPTAEFTFSGVLSARKHTRIRICHLWYSIGNIL